MIAAIPAEADGGRPSARSRLAQAQDSLKKVIGLLDEEGAPPELAARVQHVLDAIAAFAPSSEDLTP